MRVAWYLSVGGGEAAAEGGWCGVLEGGARQQDSPAQGGDRRGNTLLIGEVSCTVRLPIGALFKYFKILAECIARIGKDRRIRTRPDQGRWVGLLWKGYCLKIFTLPIFSLKIVWHKF